MKRVKLNIGKGLRIAMLALSILGGSYAISKTKPVTQITYGFTISLLGLMRKHKITVTEDEEKTIKAFDAELQEQLTAWAKENNKGILEKGAFTEFLKANPDIATDLNIKDYKIGEKSIEEWMRDMGKEMKKTSDLFSKNGGGKPDNELKRMLAEKMPEIERIFKNSKGSVGFVTINCKAAEIMTTENVGDSTAVEAVGDITDSFRVDGFVPKRQDRQFIFDVASRTFTTDIEQYITWDEEGDAQGALEIVEEGEVKPLMSFTTVRNVSEVQKAAGKIIVTEEFTKFRKRLWTIVQNLFNQKVLRDYQNMLTVNLIAAAGAYTATSLDGTIANPTKFHAIAAAAALLESRNFNPDVLVINPQDKWSMMLLQDNEGRWYTNIITDGVDGQPRIMGFRVVSTNKMPVGDFLLAEGGLWTIEEEAVQMRMGYGISVDGEGTVSSDFDTNRFRIIGELFFHDYIASNNSGSLVKDSYATIMEALASVEGGNP